MNDLEINKIYHECNLNTMLQMDDNFVDMVITSPPYNVGNNNMTENKYNNDVDRKNTNEYEEWLFKIIDELLRITKTHVFFNIQMLSNNKSTIFKLFGRYADKIKDIIIWDKNQPTPAIERGVLTSKFEFIIIFSNENPNKRKFLNGNFHGNFTNVVKGNNASGNIYAKEHRATFPLYLPRTFLLKFGKEQDLIYDPFMGSGTTALACIKENRNYIGSEISKEYIELSNKRIDQHTAQKTLF